MKVIFLVNKYSPLADVTLNVACEFLHSSELTGGCLRVCHTVDLITGDPEVSNHSDNSLSNLSHGPCSLVRSSFEPSCVSHAPSIYPGIRFLIGGNQDFYVFGTLLSESKHRFLSSLI